MKRKIFAFCMLAMFAAVTLSAATAKIRKVWLEHNVTINNKKAMKVHCEFDVQGMNGKTGSMLIWIKGPSGKWHHVNSQYKSTTGIPYFKWDYKPNYDNAYYEDYWYAPYVADLNILSGKNDYKVVVTITDEHQHHIAQSDEITFTGTGSGGSNNNNSNQNQQRSAPKPSVQQNQYTQSWREDLPGGFVIVTKHPGGATQRVRYRACPSCYGSAVCNNCYGRGICALCNGQGGIISAGYGTYIPCGLCNSTGLCGICKGTKQCYCTQNDNPYPGYVIGGETWMDARGNVISKEKVNYNGGVNDTHYGNEGGNSRRSSGKKTCPDCSGTRLFQGGHSPEYAQPRSELVGYYNSQGSKCPHCGYYSQHWHSRCTTCMHIPGTKNPYR